MGSLMAGWDSPVPDDKAGMDVSFLINYYL